MHWEARFQLVAGSHHGLIAKFHLPEIGCTSEHWWRAIRSGRWHREGRRVLRSGGAPPTLEQRLLAAILDASPGAVLHGPSALAYQGLRGYNLADLHVARARDISGAPAELARLHELRALRAHHVTVLHGIVTETALRAIWSEAAWYAPRRRYEIGLDRIGHLLDQAHRLGLVTWAGLHEMVDDIHERGRAGTVLMRALAAERMPGSSPTESRLESQFEKVLQRHDQRLFRRQEVLGGHELVGRCDFADDECPLAAEVNSLTFHTTPTDRAADERRYQALMDAGFSLCVIWEDDLWSAQSGVVRTVIEARRHARAGRRVVVHSPGCPWPRPRIGEVPPP